MKYEIQNQQQKKDDIAIFKRVDHHLQNHTKAKKRGASKSPETLRYDDPESAHEPKNKLSQRAIKINESHDLAISDGAKLEHHPSFGAWNIALGRKKDPFHQQMKLRKLPFNKSTTIAAMTKNDGI